MKNELKEIKKNLKATLTGFKDAEKEYGYDLANETHYVKQALKKVNLLLLHNVVGRSKQLVCCENCTHFGKLEKTCSETCVNWSAHNKANYTE